MKDAQTIRLGKTIAVSNAGEPGTLIEKDGAAALVIDAQTAQTGGLIRCRLKHGAKLAHGSPAKWDPETRSVTDAGETIVGTIYGNPTSPPDTHVLVAINNDAAAVVTPPAETPEKE